MKHKEFSETVQAASRNRKPPAWRGFTVEEAMEEAEEAMEEVRALLVENARLEGRTRPPLRPTTV
jgi:hypothetical protein